MTCVFTKQLAEISLLEFQRNDLLDEIQRLQSRIAELEAKLKEPIIANCFINGEGIKEGWSFSGCDDKCIVTPQSPKEVE